jgi:hypothetical protein
VTRPAGSITVATRSRSSIYECRCMGYGTALAWILTIIGVLMVVIMMKLERRFVFYESEE